MQSVRPIMTVHRAFRSVISAGNRVLVHCRAGCDQQRIIASLRARIVGGAGHAEDLAPGPAPTSAPVSTPISSLARFVWHFSSTAIGSYAIGTGSRDYLALVAGPTDDAGSFALAAEAVLAVMTPLERMNRVASTRATDTDGSERCFQWSLASRRDGWKLSSVRNGNGHRLVHGGRSAKISGRTNSGSCCRAMPSAKKHSTSKNVGRRPVTVNGVARNDLLYLVFRCKLTEFFSTCTAGVMDDPLTTGTRHGMRCAIT